MPSSYRAILIILNKTWNGIRNAGTMAKALLRICFSILQEAGYKIGVIHLSPHLVDYRGELKLTVLRNWKFVCDFIESTNRHFLKPMTLVFRNECWTSLLYRSKQVDIAIIEVGGPSWCHNIITPFVPVIANIELIRLNSLEIQFRW
jgi:folylpolyglutamate synthase/dihydropteroate synthase